MTTTTSIDTRAEAQSEIRGILIHVSSPSIRETETADDIEVVAVNLTAAEALDIVIADEGRDICFDRQSADKDDRETYDGMLGQLAAAAWSTDAAGTLFLPSIWSGGLDEEGTEWRFVPVSTSPCVAVAVDASDAGPVAETVADTVHIASPGKSAKALVDAIEGMTECAIGKLASADIDIAVGDWTKVIAGRIDVDCGSLTVDADYVSVTGLMTIHVAGRPSIERRVLVTGNNPNNWLDTSSIDFLP